MKKICFNIIKYFPSLGGTELLAKQVIDHIVGLNKYDITVKTTPEPGRDIKQFNYHIKEDVFITKNEDYDLCFFFSDLWSPQLNNYKFSSNRKHACVLNLDDLTYKSKSNFTQAINNLKLFDSTITFSKKGIVNKLLKEEKIINQYIPNPSRDVLSTKKSFDLKKILNLDNKKNILYCASFYKIKNQIYLLNQINLNKKLKEYNWIFIGNEADKLYHLECLKFCKENNLNNVYYINSTTNISKLDTLYQEVDIVALLSLGEGMPLTILEAISANKPVVCTPVGGISGVLENALENGIYMLNSTQYTAEELDDKLKKALSYKENNLRNIWSANHTKESVLLQYSNLIDNLLEK